MRYYRNPPLVILPLSMMALNASRFLMHLYAGEVKITSVCWFVLYASTVPAALRGEIEPFVNIASRTTLAG